MSTMSRLRLARPIRRRCGSHLAEHGVEIIEEGDRVGALGDTLSFYIRDPDGNQIELSFPPAQRA